MVVVHNILALYHRLRAAMEQAKWTWEVIFVDDDSTDTTFQLPHHQQTGIADRLSPNAPSVGGSIQVGKLSSVIRKPVADDHGVDEIR